MTNLDTTTAAAGFASSNGEDADNRPTNPFDALLKTAYKYGVTQGKGDGSRLDLFDLTRVGTLEDTIKPNLDLKRGPQSKKAKAAAKAAGKEDPIEQISRRFLDGVVKAGGNASKATQKNRLQTIAVWNAEHQGTREQAAVWERVKAAHEGFEERKKKGDKKTKFYALAEVMLRVAQVYTKDRDRTTPLTDAEIEFCIKKVPTSRDYIDALKAFIKVHTAQVEAEGGDDADEEFKTLLESANKLLTHIAPQYEAAQKDAEKADKIERLIREGILRRTKAGRVIAA